MIPSKRLNRGGKHYRYQDSPSLRTWCAAKKADRELAREPKPKSRSAGFSSWQALSLQFDLLRRQIGEKWKQFDTAQVDSIRKQIKPILAFDRQLSNLR